MKLKDNMLRQDKLYFRKNKIYNKTGTDISDITFGELLGHQLVYEKPVFNCSLIFFIYFKG